MIQSGISKTFSSVANCSQFRNKRSSNFSFSGLTYILKPVSTTSTLTFKAHFADAGGKAAPAAKPTGISQVTVVKKKKEEKKTEEDAPKPKFTKDDELRAVLFAFKVSTPYPKLELTGQARDHEKKVFELYKKNKPLQRKEIKDDLDNKLKAKLAAIAELPEKFKEEANKLDLALMPANRWIPTHRIPPTFPFPNFTNNQGIPVMIENPREKNKKRKKRTDFDAETSKEEEEAPPPGSEI